MTAEALKTGSFSVAQWRQDIAAGLVVAIITLPVCLAPGVLVFSALGPGYVAEGAAAGLFGAIVAGVTVILLWSVCSGILVLDLVLQLRSTLT